MFIISQFLWIRDLHVTSLDPLLLDHSQGYNQSVGQSWVSFKGSTGEGSAFKPHLVVGNVQSLQTVELKASVPNCWTEATLSSSQYDSLLCQSQYRESASKTSWNVVQPNYKSNIFLIHGYNGILLLSCVNHSSCLRLFVTPWTGAC